MREYDEGVIIFNDFAQAIEYARSRFPSEPTPVMRWQGIDISKRPEMQMHEINMLSFKVRTHGVENLNPFREAIKPNLPWADDHFEERVCGRGINPGIEWKNWPYGTSAANFLDGNVQFNHNYMERYWPNHSFLVQATKTVQDWEEVEVDNFPEEPEGIRHKYGDLAGVVRHLATEPTTRQAILPVWFPEDTGDVHSGRKPCSLTYQFLMRDNQLHMVYNIRSCDFVRHFRDDLYLTLRLQKWMLNQCRHVNQEVWNPVMMGKFFIQIGNLHMFRNDYIGMFDGS